MFAEFHMKFHGCAVLQHVDELAFSAGRLGVGGHLESGQDIHAAFDDGSLVKRNHSEEFRDEILTGVLFDIAVKDEMGNCRVPGHVPRDVDVVGQVVIGAVRRQFQRWNAVAKRL